MIQTRFTEMLGVKYPIMQGGMQHLGVAAFASTVSNAGGLGTINISCFPSVEAFREDLLLMRELTDRPYAVNISLLPGLSQGPRIQQFLEVCAQLGVAAVEVAGGDPSEWIPLLKEAGIKLIHKSPNLTVARRMVEKGADIITIIGSEVAGHPSPDGIGTMIMANQAAASLEVPVLAAGGIADGKGLAAALALGCEGVVMGTRFVATEECRISQNHKEWVVGHDERDTKLLLSSVHNQLRAADNKAARLCLELEAAGTSLDGLMPVIGGDRGRDCYQTGNVDDGIFCVGPAMALIHDIKPIQVLLEGMVAEAEAIFSHLHHCTEKGE